MEISIRQAAMLAVINANPKILGPDLYVAVADFVPQIQFQQFLGRLRKQGLVTTKSANDGTRRVEVSITPDGKEKLESAIDLCKFTLRKVGKT